MGKHTNFDNMTVAIARSTDRRSLLKAALGLGAAGLIAGTKLDSTFAAGWTPADKCKWLQDNLPQNSVGLQNFAVKYANSDNVSAERIAPTIYVCNEKGDSVYDGFIILGPRDGHHEGAFTVTVPPHGAVEAYAAECGAKYSETPTLVAKLPDKCDSTYLAAKGTVTAERVTVYGWNDFNAPIGQKDSIKTMVDSGSSGSSGGSSSGNGATASPAAADAMCMSVADLAKTSALKGKFDILDDAQQPDSVTKYGGRIIHVTADNVTVPAGWEAVGPDNVHIKAGGKLANGVYVSLYPPTGACRNKLGVSN